MLNNLRVAIRKWGTHANAVMSDKVENSDCRVLDEVICETVGRASTKLTDNMNKKFADLSRFSCSLANSLANFCLNFLLVSCMLHHRITDSLIKCSTIKGLFNFISHKNIGLQIQLNYL